MNPEKKYDVIGIGHALVDREWTVTDEELAQLGIAKGTMTLVDAERQEGIAGSLAGAPHHDSCGGSAANTVIAVAQFGGRAFFICKVAPDTTGNFFATDLKANGVDSRALDHPAEGISGRCLVLVSADAERTLCTHLGVSQKVSPEDLEAVDLAQGHFLYIEGYLVSSPTALEAALVAGRRARAKGTKIALTFSDVNMIAFFREGMAQLVGLTPDLIFCNLAEALEYARTSDQEVAVTELLRHTRMLCLTLGNRGALIATADERIAITGKSVTAIDSNGAGDLFAGAFLYGITHGLPLEAAGQLARDASAQLVTQFGARLKSHQAQEILALQERNR
ncbi:MAG: adenosine kinase [Magnetococcales bacterium]|nr:adenosine kinase [Magnetococcales bacterium]MBF0156239.1 adenosine kinase [Magnetococcales bacterium]